jgi:hypothetical protein
VPSAKVSPKVSIAVLNWGRRLVILVRLLFLKINSPGDAESAA